MEASGGSKYKPYLVVVCRIAAYGHNSWIGQAGSIRWQ